MSDGWTDIAAPPEHQKTIETRLDFLEARITGIETQLREILGHCRQQSIIQRASLPFSSPLGGESADVFAARATNMALRKKVPIPFKKSSTQ